MMYAHTAHNRTVYATPAVAGLVFRSLGHSATLHSHAHSRHIFAVAGNLRFPATAKTSYTAGTLCEMLLNIVDK
jgi:hypothetical protein